MLELRAFAVGRKGNLAAALSERLKHLSDAVKGFDPWQILGFVDLSLFFAGFAFAGPRQARWGGGGGGGFLVKLQRRIRDLQTGPIKCLGAYQVMLVETAQANMTFAFEFSRRLATIRSPLEFLNVIAEFASDRIAMFGKYSKEMAQLSVKRSA